MSTTQTLRPTRASRRPSVVTLALVGALHIVVIYGLYLGLSGKFQFVIPPGPIDYVAVPPKKAPPLPQPPQPKFVDPTVTSIPTPDLHIDRDQPNTGITATPEPLAHSAGDTPQPVILAARGIVATHTIPEYPLLSVRLGQTGDVKLKLTIDEHGSVVAATVEKSSGYDALDNAAVAWVIGHWRYEPATKDGKPFATSTDALVTFRLTGR